MSEAVLPQKQHTHVSLCFIPLCPCLRTTFPWEECATTKSWFCPKAAVCEVSLFGFFFFNWDIAGLFHEGEALSSLLEGARS